MTAVSPAAKRHRTEYHKLWRAAKPHKTREYWLKRYGLMEEEYQALLVKQGGHCALCPKIPEEEVRKVLSIDHDHDTKLVRGLLCMRCNSGLGSLGDNEAGLARALAYIRGW